MPIEEPYARRGHACMRLLEPTHVGMSCGREFSLFCAGPCSALRYLGGMFTLLGFHLAIWHAVTHHAKRGNAQLFGSQRHPMPGEVMLAYASWSLPLFEFAMVGNSAFLS